MHEERNSRAAAHKAITEVGYNGAPQTHVALITMQMTEKQQLAMYTYSQAVQIGTFRPIITF